MKIVLDANISIALVVPVTYSDKARERMQAWQDQNVELCVPSLWGYEVVSSLRKAVAIELISEEEAGEGLENLLLLGIREIPATEMLLAKTLQWAGKLGQTVAYDSAFVALAEHLGVEFWTADQKLARVAAKQGLSWVRQL